VVAATTASSRGSPTASRPPDRGGRLADGLGRPGDHHRAPPQRGVGAGGHGQERTVGLDRRRLRDLDLGQLAGTQPGQRRHAGGAGAGHDHPAAVVEHLDEQLVGLVDGQRAPAGGVGGQHLGHVLGPQPGRGPQLPD
jgi:hypothetical protein